MIVLGIESTCDETAAALVEDGRHLLSNVISTSVKEQALYGGVVPEIASRRHCEFISATVKKALLDAGKTMDDVDAVAVTFAPGLIGAVLVGVNFAKGLAYSAGKPLVPVHHLRGHIAALYLTHPELKPPFLCLVASGGHSHIVEVQDYTHYHILGHTVDDAAGEAFDKESIVKIIRSRAPVYDKGRDGHYNLISAVHKSLRGSDVDAALYWVARMIEGGEDPKYLLRRLTRFAVEDVSMADPNAVNQAISCWDTYERLGSPEGDLAVFQLAAYLATAPMSAGVYKAMHAARDAARRTGSLMPPKNILNAPTKLMKQLGYNEGYEYDPDCEDGFSGANYFPDGMKRMKLYYPVDRGFEREVKKRIEYFDRLRAEKQARKNQA